MVLHINPLVDPLVVYPSRFGVGILLCGAAAHKLRDLARFEAVLGGYQIFPVWLIPLLVRLVPVLELLTGVALFFSMSAESAALVSATLFLGYGVLLFFSLTRGTPVADCGCSFGGTKNQPGDVPVTQLSSALIWRNLVLSLISMNLEQAMTQRDLGLFDVTAIFLFTLIGAVFYTLANTLISTQQSTRNLFHE